MTCVEGSKIIQPAAIVSEEQDVFKFCRKAVLFLHYPGAIIYSKRHIEIDFWLSRHTGKAK